MSALAYAGAALLAAATVPQAVALTRERTARGFTWPFVLLNLGGLVLLSLRSVQIDEPAFFAVNALGVLFWSGLAFVKTRETTPRRIPRQRRHPYSTASTLSGAVVMMPETTRSSGGRRRIR